MKIAANHLPAFMVIAVSLPGIGPAECKSDVITAKRGKFKRIIPMDFSGFNGNVAPRKPLKLTHN